jgi:hypothetical protein
MITPTRTRPILRVAILALCAAALPPFTDLGADTKDHATTTHANESIAIRIADALGR